MASLADISIRFSTNLKQFSTEMQNASRQMRAVGKQMQTTGRNLTAGLTLPLVAAAAAATKLALDFDDNMTKIQTLVGLSSEKVRELRKEVLNLAGDTSKAPEELSRALFTVTSAGIRGAEAMEILGAAAKASSVGLGDTTEVARATTAVLQAYGKENISAARAADILTATVREGNLEASELAPVLGRVIGLASQLDISFEEVGASIATFTRLGVDSAEAVTGLRGVMNALIKPTSAGRDALKSVGSSFEQLRKEVKEKGLAQSLVGLVEAFKGNDEALGTIIPNVRALSAVLGTAGSQSKEYQRIVKSLTNSQGILDKAFEKTSQTAGFKTRKALTDLKVVAVELGSIILPVVADLARSLSSLTDAFKGLNPAQQKTIVATLAFAAAIGPATLLIGTMITAVGKMAATMKVLRVAMAATPWGLVAAGAGVLAIAFGSLLSVKKKLNSSETDLTTDLEKEKTGVNTLVGAITSLNKNNETRKGLLQDLKSKYPGFLGNLDSETVTNKQLRDRLREVNKEYVKRIAIQASADDLNKNLQAQKKLLDNNKELVLVNQKLEESYRAIDQISKAEELQKRMAGNKAIIDLNTTSLEKLRQEAQETKRAYEELAGAAFGESAGTQQKPKTERKEAPGFLAAKDLVLPFRDASEQIKLIGFDTTQALTDQQKSFLDEYTSLTDQISNIGQSAFIGIGNVLSNVFSSMLDGAKVTVGGIIKELGKMIIRLGIAAAAAAALRAILGDSSAARDGANAAKSIGGVLRGLASGGGFGGSRSSGGPVTAGMTYLTSEHMKGEMFVPNQNGRIYTANDMQGRSGGVNSTIRIVGEFIQRGPDLVLAIDQANRVNGRYSG